MATTTIAPDLLQTDLLVLHNLLQNIRDDRRASPKDEIPLKSPDQTSTVALAESLPSSSSYEDEPTLSQLSLLKDRPTAFCTWDLDDHVFSTTKDPSSSPTALKNHILHRYVTFAQTIVRNPLDVVFLTHILLYLSTSVPSAILLYNNFTVLHAVLHWLMQSYYCGSFTLLLHNHIHNGGLFMRTPWLAVADYVWPYVLEPLMGHTWDSYYWHHVKHHHVENNGPGDLSSTIWYQRDEFTHFLIYLGRFMFLIWIELPAYFLKKRRYRDAIVVFAKEMGTYAAIVMLARWKFLPTLFVFIIPLIQMRIGLMVGNWGQHALVDEEDPESDFRSSITLIDVPSNRYCFNDGWHTSHHLNPRRHWRDHPRAFLSIKQQYTDGRALIFHNIDFLMITYRLLRKDYFYLADCLVPIGEQVNMTRTEIAKMLERKTKRFTRERVQKVFGVKKV